jgi:hypothetical protein
MRKPTTCQERLFVLLALVAFCQFCSIGLAQTQTVLSQTSRSAIDSRPRTSYSTSKEKGLPPGEKNLPDVPNDIEEIDAGSVDVTANNSSADFFRQIILLAESAALGQRPPRLILEAGIASIHCAQVTQGQTRERAPPIAE